MAGSEQELRKEAVRRRLAGESAVEVGRGLGRSTRWVQKWVRRHDPTHADWAKGTKRGPQRAANRTAESVEAQVLGVRERLAERSRPRRRKPKGIPYPQAAAEVVGDLHEADLVGPRYLDGGVRFYALNTVDLAPRRAGIEIVGDKSDHAVAGALVALWQRLGVPVRAKFDNGGPFIGARGLGLDARLCLHNGVTPVFIPVGEPWRNGVVERFNDTFDKRFFRTERFSSRAALEQRALAFERFHNAHHRYAAIGGHTPTRARTSASCAGPRRSKSFPTAGQRRDASSSSASFAPTASCASCVAPSRCRPGPSTSTSPPCSTSRSRPPRATFGCSAKASSWLPRASPSGGGAERARRLCARLRLASRRRRASDVGNETLAVNQPLPTRTKCWRL